MIGIEIICFFYGKIKMIQRKHSDITESYLCIRRSPFLLKATIEHYFHEIKTKSQSFYSKETILRL